MVTARLQEKVLATKERQEKLDLEKEIGQHV